MPLRKESSGGASLLDAILYDHFLVPTGESLERAHLRPSDLSEAKTNDSASTGPN